MVEIPRWGSEFTHWKSTPISVIPAEAGIQAVSELEHKTNLDAGVRRHDELSLRLEPRVVHLFTESAVHQFAIVRRVNAKDH
jgi:hypothetical protein